MTPTMLKQRAAGTFALGRRSLIVAVAALAATAALPAASGRAMAQDAGAFVQKLGETAIKTFAEKSNPVAVKQKFTKLLVDNFDIPRIGSFVMGPYWKRATEEQRKEFIGLLEKMIVEMYAGRFAEYSGETLKVGAVRPDGDSESLVSSQIVRPNGPPMNIEWRVLQSGASYKIIDVAVEGLSMRTTQKSEYVSSIQGNGGQIDVFLKTLKAKIPG